MSPTVTPFSELLRRRSRTAAGPAVWTGGAHDLLAGECDVADYADLLGQYAVVYDALERARRTDGRPPRRRTVRHDAAHPDAGDPRRPRVPGRTRLVRALLPTAATTAYVRRLCAVAATSPGAFVAHHYTRYLGDLTGGPTLARLLEDRFGFDNERRALHDLRPGGRPRGVRGHVPGAARRGTLVRRRTRCRARRGRAGGEPGPGARGVVRSSPDGRGRPRRVAAPRLTGCCSPPDRVARSCRPRSVRTVVVTCPCAPVQCWRPGTRSRRNVRGTHDGDRRIDAPRRARDDVSGAVDSDLRADVRTSATCSGGAAGDRWRRAAARRREPARRGHRGVRGLRRRGCRPGRGDRRRHVRRAGRSRRPGLHDLLPPDEPGRGAPPRARPPARGDDGGLPGDSFPATYASLVEQVGEDEAARLADLRFHPVLTAHPDRGPPSRGDHGGASHHGPDRRARTAPATRPRVPRTSVGCSRRSRPSCAPRRSARPARPRSTRSARR